MLRIKKSTQNANSKVSKRYGWIKLDLKTHPNMSLSVKQSRLRLSSNKIAKKDYLDGLKEIRAKRNVSKKIPFQEIQLQQFGSQIFFNKLLYYCFESFIYNNLN